MKAEKGLRGGLQGTGKVFRFTLTETLKMKANIVTMVIMLGLALFSVPLGSLMLGDSSYGYEDETAAEETDYNYGTLTEAQLEYLQKEGISEEVLDALKMGANGDSWDSVEDYEAYADAIRDLYENEESETGLDSGLQNMSMQMIYAILVMMLCLLATSYIIRIVLEEKTSKLVDLLMVSVKPMALLLGKILAMLVYVLGLFVIMVCGALVSFNIFGNTVDISYLGTVTPESFDFTLLFLKMILVMGISAVLGYIGFGFLAGVLGAGCSNTDEASGAMGFPMLLVMSGYFAAIMTSMSSDTTLQTILSVIPILNMYVAPVQFVAGNIGLPVLILSWIVEILWAMGGIWLSSRVYASLIINNGRRVKLKGILRMAVKGVA